MGDKGKQMELDLRCDLDRELTEQVVEITNDLADKLLVRNGHLARSRYEGYGILAGSMAQVAGGVKAVKKDMEDLLVFLSSDDFNAAGVVANINMSVTKLIIDAMKMGAETKRIEEDIRTGD